jgi:hypothetical protein
MAHALFRINDGLIIFICEEIEFYNDVEILKI